MRPRPIIAPRPRSLARLLSGLLAASILAAGAAQAGDGAALFQQNCALCHQSGAIGLAGQFPRLAGRVSHIAGDARGRAYLIDVLTYGMSGNVTVDGQPIFGLMPPFSQLPADVVADVLSYVQTLGDAPKKKPVAFTTEEIAARRQKPPKTADEVHDERKSLLAAKVVE
jgi:mono/diheme cytochrome c family protein